MTSQLIFPKRGKSDCPTEYHLSSHGPVVFTGALPDYVAVECIDEKLESTGADRSDAG